MARYVDDHRSGRRGQLLLARAILGLTLVAMAGGITFSVLEALRSREAVLRLTDLPFLVAFAAFPAIGYILASRRPENAISWLLLGVGAAFGIDIALGAYSDYALHGGLGGRSLGTIVAGIEGPMWVPIVALPATFLILLFPSGHLPSPRWRWFARLLSAGLVIVFLAILLGPGTLDNSSVPGLENPLGVGWLRPLLPFALALIALLPIGIVASLVSLVRRFRRSAGVERLQLRWLVTAAGIVALLYAIALPVGLVTGWGQTSTPLWVNVLQNVAIVSFALIPISIGVSVLLYRLL
jgi:hypothetical protein